MPWRAYIARQRYDIQLRIGRLVVMTAAERRAWNEAIERAAQIADPPLMHRAGKPGMWRVRRAKIAADIRACKVES